MQAGTANYFPNRTFWDIACLGLHLQRQAALLEP
jgi:hypothetical protein